MNDMKMQMAFINRKREVEELRNYLCTPANSILFLHGPKSSGKTTLMYRLYMPDKQKRLMVELMNFFVAMTKKIHLCHVIIASSDAFFVEQVYVDSKLRKTSQFMKLDYLEKEDVFIWLSDVGQYNKVKEYTLNKQQIEVIWDTVGGSTWEIYFILEHLFQRPLTEIVDKMKREKVAMIADWCFRDPSGARKKVLEPYG